MLKSRSNTILCRRNARYLLENDYFYSQKLRLSAALSIAQASLALRPFERERSLKEREQQTRYYSNYKIKTSLCQDFHHYDTTHQSPQGDG